MSNKVIGDYTAANSIDGSNHYLLIQPGGSSTAYNKINRNVFLGVTGQPADISSSQSLTNKTLNNTNTLTLLDTNFTLQDNSDSTKQAQFQLSGITTSTTRTYTLPNVSDTLVTLTASQTLTNKTITSPTISGGTIDNTTITVDSIAGHTSSTIVTVANLQISNGVLNSANAVTATSIAAGAVQPQALVSGTGSGWAWQTWTPSYGNINIGNGTVIAKYTQIGKTVIARYNLVFGTTTTLSSSQTISLPVTASSAYTAGVDPLGSLVGVHSTTYAGGVAYFVNTTTLGFYIWNVAGTYLTQSSITSTVPFTWATSDQLLFEIVYEAA